jgi:hypothetical protein
MNLTPPIGGVTAEGAEDVLSAPSAVTPPMGGVRFIRAAYSLLRPDDYGGNR